MIERENRTVVEAARTMLDAKGISLNLWPEATTTGVRVLNRTGTSIISGKTPYELWFGKQLSNTNFKIFSTKVFTHIPKQKRKKWSPKAKEGTFVGYDENTKGRRVFFQDQNKVGAFRDVSFEPENFYASQEREEKDDKSDF